MRGNLRRLHTPDRINGGRYTCAVKSQGRTMTAPATKRDLVRHRLHRIEGQVRGISRLVEEDAPCVDILTQISAANRALQSVALVLLDDHLVDCLAEASNQAGGIDTTKLTEASQAVARLIRI